MSSNNLSNVAGSLYSPATPTASPKAAETTSQAGFDAKLQAAASAAEPAQAPQTGGASETREAQTPAGGGGSRQYGWHFSFFLRINGELGNWGRPLQTQFCEASRAVAETFLGRDGWNGDPVGMFLQKADRAVAAGPDTATSYLGSIRQASLGGMESMVDSMISWTGLGTSAGGLFGPGGLGGAGTGGLFGSGSMGFGGTRAPTPLPGTGALDMARLRISTLGQTASSAPARPLPHNRNGVAITMVSLPVPAEPHLELGTPGTTADDPAHRFLEKFLDLVKEFLKDFSSFPEATKPAAADDTGAGAATGPADDPPNDSSPATTGATLATNPSAESPEETQSSDGTEEQQVDNPVTVA